MWPRAPPGRKWIRAKIANNRRFSSRTHRGTRTFIFLSEIAALCRYNCLKNVATKGPLRGIKSANYIERASSSFKGQKPGSNPVLGRFWWLLRRLSQPNVRHLAYDARVWTLFEQISIIWGTRRRKHPQGYRSGEGGYENGTTI